MRGVDGAQPDRICRAPLELLLHHSPAAVLSITRSSRRMDIEARTERQLGILSDYGAYSLCPATYGIKIKRRNLWYRERRARSGALPRLRSAAQSELTERAHWRAGLISETPNLAAESGAPWRRQSTRSAQTHFGTRPSMLACSAALPSMRATASSISPPPRRSARPRRSILRGLTI